MFRLQSTLRACLEANSVCGDIHHGWDGWLGWPGMGGLGGQAAPVAGSDSQLQCASALQRIKAGVPGTAKYQGTALDYVHLMYARALACMLVGVCSLPPLCLTACSGPGGEGGHHEDGCQRGCGAVSCLAYSSPCQPSAMQPCRNKYSQAVDGDDHGHA